MNKVIYTVVTGGYDTVKATPVKGFDMVVLTDDPDLKVKGWRTVVVAPWSNPKKLSRYLKIMAHLFIDADVYVYLDANYQITGDLAGYVGRFEGGYLAFNHWKRKCIYDEAVQVMRLKKEEKTVVRNQVATYQRNGHPAGWGLFANGFFIRDKTANELCSKWWDEVNVHSYRDQLSLPFVARKSDVFRSVDMPKILTLRGHEPYKTKGPDVYYFSPRSGDKMLGEWYNKHCELVPNGEDWICIMDQDAMALHPYNGKLIEDAIKVHGEDYQLFSCMTNRLGLKWQLPYGMDDGWGMERNMEIAKEHYEKYYCEVEECKKPTAGFFMLFQKKTWMDNKFQPGIIGKDGLFIDWRFSNGILQSGGKIGLLKGLYVFHLYRMWKKTSNIDHLRA